ncbi:MAG: glutamate--tRNA ligase [Hyphomicrobium sp.]|uniref:glutamate--tRNA ligase n=1 Tax=Hyphomicrobium sp. TaxID=82 RepID=UPI001323CA95|nr:glutamate--tRNA ligase [Hyphomicrobium sp.]KAB2941115.1 MAG: glutamate--tRNA ligase [Hyphomicrobium sp.]MBZ0211014.1 glutamate--tRNA ligase [Hyphomicrobium sp.]
MTEKTRNGGAPVVRFAPSPTGYLHIGGARTALFNWLYAKGRGGKILLRIEDTDRERNNPAAVAAILDGLKWLQLDWDGDTVSQFARAQRHRQVAEELLARGRAYKCWLTPAELDKMREEAQAEKRPLTIRSPWRDRDPSEAPAGVPYVIRLKAPREGETVVDDLVQGRVVFANKELDDLIILRSDGNPTYNLAVVVDDHDMKITHIIRGVDHLTNAARQTQIYQAMGWQVPLFAHVPLIHGPDGAKLSKRHGALGVEAYKEMGYLPAALRNYLARLGWSHGNDEIMSTSQMLDWFDLKDINRAAARFDFAKLEDLNGHYIRSADDQELLLRIEDLLPYLPGGAAITERLDANMRAKLLIAMPGLKERAKTLVELIHGAEFLFADRPLALDEKAQKLLDVEGRQTLNKLLPRLEAASRWSATELEAIVRSYAEAAGAKLGKVAQPLRAALTGKSVSPPVFDVMAVLGREEALARIRDQAT